jgi:hypothetical protein
MSWSGNASINLKMARIEQLGKRTEETILPPIDKVFERMSGLDSDFCKDVIDKIYYSNYPGAKERGASTLRSFTTNKNSVQVMKDSGAVGAVIEMLKNLAIPEDIHSQHATNLITSLHTFAKDDKKVYLSLLTNDEVIPMLLGLCFNSSGNMQELVFDVLESLASVSSEGLEGTDLLIEAGACDTILTPELLYRHSTLLSVRRRATALLLKLVTRKPSALAIHSLGDLVLTEIGTRRIDGQMEIHILSCINRYLADPANPMEPHQKIFPYFTNEIKNETFDGLDHLELLLKCVLIVSVRHEHIDYLLEAGDLIVTLQHVVKTDFQFASSAESYGLAKPNIEHLKQRKTKGGVVKFDQRPKSTLICVSLVKPEPAPKERSRRGNDINYQTTRVALQIYQNVMEYKPDVISSLVSSGLVAALMHRIGSGREIDYRFNKLMVRFLYLLVLKVKTASLGEGGHFIGLTTIRKKLSSYMNSAAEDSMAGVDTKQLSLEKEVKFEKVPIHKDLKMISRLLVTQGVTLVFTASMSRTDDEALILDALVTLSVMSFESVAPYLFDEGGSRLAAMSYIGHSRSDCFFPVVAICLSAILYHEVPDEVLDSVVASYGLSILLRALKYSGWVFHEKAIVYKALTHLCSRQLFMPKLANLESSLVASLVYVLILRIKQRKRRKRRANQNDEEDRTEVLFTVMKKLWAATMIQCVVRAKFAKVRVKSLREERAGSGWIVPT